MAISLNVDMSSDVNALMWLLSRVKDGVVRFVTLTIDAPCECKNDVCIVPMLSLVKVRK